MEFLLFLIFLALELKDNKTNTSGIESELRKIKDEIHLLNQKKK